MGVREGIWGCCRWHLVHICPRSCSYLFQTCCILSICGMVMLLRSLMVMIWLKIEKRDKRCQLSSPPHPGCQVEEECVGFNFVFCFNTFPHLAPKGPPVVLPSQVIMVPCVFGWGGAFSLKESLWRNLCLFQRQHHHCNNLEILFRNQYKARHNWFALFFTKNYFQNFFQFAASRWLVPGRISFPFSPQIERRGSERSSIQDFQKTDSVISTSFLLISNIWNLPQKWELSVWGFLKDMTDVKVQKKSLISSTIGPIKISG